MLIARHHEPAPPQTPGWHRDCLAGLDRSAGAFEVWRCSLDAGAASPWLAVPGYQVVLALAGQGKLRLASGPYRFDAPCTLCIAPQAEHQFTNLGTQALLLIVVQAPGAHRPDPSNPENDPRRPRS